MRNILVIVIIVALIALGIFAFYRNQARAPQQPSVDTTYVAPTSDSPDAIQNELNSIDTGANLDADFQATDKDIKTL